MKSIKCFIETPKGSGVKYTYAPLLAALEMTKVLPVGMTFPFDFGFLPGTKGEDGDPLDILILSEIPVLSGSIVECRIIGGLSAIQQERDGKEMRNDRYIGVPEISEFYKNVQHIKQLPIKLRTQIEEFFINYNEQAGKKFKPLKWISNTTAIRIIEVSKERADPAQLIQLFLPLKKKSGRPVSQALFERTKKELLETFHGITLYRHSPVEGICEKDNIYREHDKNIIMEIMAPEIDRSFWEKYLKKLEKRFEQDRLLIRTAKIGVIVRS